MISVKDIMQKFLTSKVLLMACATVVVACALMVTIPNVAAAGASSDPLVNVTRAVQGAVERVTAQAGGGLTRSDQAQATSELVAAADIIAADLDGQTPVQIASGAHHVVARRADGSLWTWGGNAGGQLGTGRPMAQTMNTTPQRIGTDSWKYVAASGTGVLAVREDGSLWGWGHNQAIGEGGVNSGPFMTSAVSAARHTTPQRIGNDSNWRSVHMTQGSAAGGGPHVMAIRTDGSLWAWGNNSIGQLGLGSSGAFVTTPQLVSAESWLTAELGGNFTFAIRADGSLWSWGGNGQGQLGRGYFSGVTPQPNPQMVGTDTWLSISTSTSTAAGIRADGSLWAWGNNGGGVVCPTTNHGLGQATKQNLGSSYQWQSVHLTINSAHAVRADGSLWGWGSNSSGQLGIGTTEIFSDVPSHTFRRVGADYDWVVAGGNSSRWAIKENGTLWTWGHNGDSGSLGKGVYSELMHPTGQGTNTNNWVPWRVATSLTPTTNHDWAPSDGATIPNNNQIWVSPDNTPYLYLFFDRLMSNDPTTWGTITFDSDGPSRTATASGFVDASFGLRGVNEMYPHEWWFHTGANSEAVRVDMTAGQMAVTVAEFNAWDTPFPFGPTPGGPAPMDHFQRGIQSVFRVPLIFGDIPDPELPMTKTLEIPQGTPLPGNEIEFEFTFTPTRAQLDAGPPVVQSRPVADFDDIIDSPQTITLDLTANRTAPPVLDATAGTYTFMGDLDLWALFRAHESDFPGGGVYVFNVTETQNTTGTTAPSQMTYNVGSRNFQLSVWICRDNELSYIEIRPLTGAGPNFTVGEKQETIGFVNRYHRNASNLEVEKIVEGRLADVTTPFLFDLTLTANSAAPLPTTITANRIAANGSISGTVTITNGVATGFQLLHQERLEIPGLPIGTGFVVREHASTLFSPAVNVYIGATGTPPHTPVYTASAGRGQELFTRQSPPIVLTAATGRNAAVFTNTNQLTPPETGLGIASSVPLLLLAALPVFAVTAFVSHRNRKAIEELAQ